MIIVWDEIKRSLNMAKHRLDFARLTPDFFETALVYPSYDERFVAVGPLVGGAIVTVAFKPVGAEAISVISMRAASRKERSLL